MKNKQVAISLFKFQVIHVIIVGASFVFAIFYYVFLDTAKLEMTTLRTLIGEGFYFYPLCITALSMLSSWIFYHNNDFDKARLCGKLGFTLLIPILLSTLGIVVDSAS